MKIQNDGVSSPSPVSTGAAARISSKSVPRGNPVEGDQPTSDTAEVSAIAHQIEADPARLERLRDAVLNGTYTVPATDVSARLIDEHLDNLNTRS